MGFFYTTAPHSDSTRWVSQRPSAAWATQLNAPVIRPRPWEDLVLTLYDNPFSPFARKVRMVLRFEGL